MDDVNELPLKYDEESYLFFVDSGQRDKTAYPTANNYSIQFDPPFTNVIGLDLLSATIPRTEYLLDHNAQQFVFRVNQGDWVTLNVESGDYNIQQLTSFLGGAISLYDSGAAIQVTSVTDIIDIQSRLKFVCSAPFEINMTATTMRNVLGFNDPISEYQAVNNYAISSAYVPGGPEYFASIPDAGNTIQVAAFSGPPPVLNSVPLTEPMTQVFTSGGAGAVTGMSIFCTTIGDPPPITIDAAVSAANGATMATLQFLLATGNIAPAGSASVNSAAPLAQGVQYAVTLPATGSDAGNCFAVQYTSPTTPRTDVPYDGFTVGNTSYGTGVMCVTVTQGEAPYVICAPGLYNLTGQRYLTLRCPQIESHLYRGRPYDPFAYGLARLPLTGFGIGEATFDFASVPRRRFSPLARLAELSFEFQRPDGSDYDFKGVDHTLTFVISYYIPPIGKMPASFFRDYQPDPLLFRQQRLQQREDRRYEGQRDSYLRGLQWTEGNTAPRQPAQLSWSDAWRGTG